MATVDANSELTKKTISIVCLILAQSVVAEMAIVVCTQIIVAVWKMSEDYCLDSLFGT